MGGKGTVTKGSSIKYGSGHYDSTAHSGKGKSQKLMPPAAGERYNRPTLHTNEAPVYDGLHAKRGYKGSGYNTDAHSTFHHGKDGEAVASKDSIRHGVQVKTS